MKLNTETGPDAQPLYLRFLTALIKFFNVSRSHEICDDLEDRLVQYHDQYGLMRTNIWLTGQTIRIIFGHLFNKLFWSHVMIKNYLRIALRNIAGQKLYALITLSGLICGLAVYILIQLTGETMRHYDQFHSNSHRIYSAVQVLPGGANGPRHSAMTPMPLGPSLLNQIPEIEQITRYAPAGQLIVSHGDKRFYEYSGRFVDSNFLEVFDFQLDRGEKQEVLAEPFSVVISDRMALKYFGDANPLGKVLTLNNNLGVTVSGVLRRQPSNSSLYFDFLFSMNTAAALGQINEDWSQRKLATFVMLREGVSAESLESSLNAFHEAIVPHSNDGPQSLYLFPLHRNFLHSEHIENCWTNGNISFAVMSVLSFLALAIACINYMNLSTARFVKRANEVGLRKVVGATRGQLMFQFLGESILMALLALPLGIALFLIIKPLYLQYIDSTFVTSLWDYPTVLIRALLTAAITGIFAGLYPALYLSSFRPVKILQGKVLRSRKGGMIRKALVVLQFFFSILILVLTLVSLKQNRHNSHVDLGFNRQRILAVSLPADARASVPLMKKEISRFNSVSMISAARNLPVSWDPQQEVTPQGHQADEAVRMDVYGVDHGFSELLEIEMLKGSRLTPERSNAGSVLINETAARQLEWEDAVGKTLAIDGRTYTVQGVTADYHFRSIAFEATLPSILMLSPDQCQYLLIKYSSDAALDELVKSVEKEWAILAPDLPFDWTTVDEYWMDYNIRSDKTVQFAGSMGGIAILLSCLGLFGLTAYSIERRTKEIGIRKVLGAAESGVVLMLSKDFLKLVAIANFIALPLASFLIHKMVHFIFIYPVAVGVLPLLAAALITLFIAAVTVASLTLKAARQNSTEALRYQ